jgi:uncharacterized protein (TIGR02301 family)
MRMLRRTIGPMSALLFLLAPTGAARAIDPPYQPQMERLAEILGSLYFLNPLCRAAATDWRAEMADLVKLDQPDDDRQQRLYGAFNGGYAAYSRLYRTCTPSAEEAMSRLLVEAESTARDIHARFAE